MSRGGSVEKAGHMAFRSIGLKLVSCIIGSCFRIYLFHDHGPKIAIGAIKK